MLPDAFVTYVPDRSSDELRAWNSDRIGTIE